MKNALRSVPPRLANPKRYGSPQRPDAAVLTNTKSEARAWFKRLLGVSSLPVGFVVQEI